MKLSKKLTSILCAAALLVSALPAAAAVSADPLSEYAGKTIPVQVVEETENGMTSRVIEVAIPEGATKAEKDALVFSAASNCTASAFSAKSSNMYVLSTETDLVIRAAEQKVGGGPRPAGMTGSFEKIAIAATITEAAGGANARLLFQVRDVANPDNRTSWDLGELNINKFPWEVVIFCNGLPTSDSGISVYAKTVPDWHIYLSSCTVIGYGA